VSAPLSAQTSRTAIRAGSVTHRYAGATGTSINSLHVIGVRCDDEDHAVGDAAVLAMGPGRAALVARLPFTVVAVGHSARAVLGLDTHGQLWRIVDGRVDAIDGADGVVQVVGAFVRRTDDTVWRVDDDGALQPVAQHVRAMGQADNEGIVGLQLDEAAGTGLMAVCRDRRGDEHARMALPPIDGTITVIAADGGELGIVAGRTLVLGQRATGEVRRLRLDGDVTCLARLAQRWFLGSKAGLFTLDDDDDRVRLWRPSLRAHQLLRVADGLVLVTDLFVATSDDGIDVASRDLSSFVRLAGG
jgi:hypothetical protein